jgi:hypothetical protein
VTIVDPFPKFVLIGKTFPHFLIYAELVKTWNFSRVNRKKSNFVEYCHGASIIIILLAKKIKKISCLCPAFRHWTVINKTKNINSIQISSFRYIQRRNTMKNNRGVDWVPCCIFQPLETEV